MFSSAPRTPQVVIVRVSNPDRDYHVTPQRLFIYHNGDGDRAIEAAALAAQLHARRRMADRLRRRRAILIPLVQQNPAPEIEAADRGR